MNHGEWLILMLGFGIAFILMLSMFNFLPDNSVGVKYNLLSGTLGDQTYLPGFVFKLPTERLYEVSTEIQTKVIDANVGPTKDAKWVPISIDIKYSVSKENTRLFFQRFGTLEKIENSLMESLVLDIIDKTTSKYGLSDILGSKRSDIYTETKQLLSDKLAEHGLDLFSVVLIYIESRIG